MVLPRERDKTTTTRKAGHARGWKSSGEISGGEEWESCTGLRRRWQSSNFSQKVGIALGFLCVWDDVDFEKLVAAWWICQARGGVVFSDFLGYGGIRGENCG